MKLLLLSLNSPEFQPLADLTDPTKAAYAARWGYKFRAVVNEGVGKAGASWRRVEQWIEHLRCCDWLFFTGTDAAITNPDIEINPDLTHDLYICVDANGIQSDSWIMRNCAATQNFLQRVLLRRNSLANEQDAMGMELSACRSYPQYYLRMAFPGGDGAAASDAVMRRLEVELNRSAVRVRLVPQKELNAYPSDVYEGRPGAQAWCPNSLVCHMPGRSLEYRLKHFPKYINHLHESQTQSA